MDFGGFGGFQVCGLRSPAGIRLTFTNEQNESSTDFNDGFNNPSRSDTRHTIATPHHQPISAPQRKSVQDKSLVTPHTGRRSLFMFKNAACQEAKVLQLYGVNKCPGR